MSLINRIEVSNFLDSKRDPDTWRPDFRWVTLRLNCYSTAILAANGIGKTSLTDGIFALLTWKKWFLDRVSIKMAPPVSAMSHFRLELVRPFHEESGNLQRLDTQTMIKGEPWVLGMCSHRGGDPRFYYYQGELEDAPLGRREGGALVLLSDAQVLESIAAVCKGISGKMVSTPSEWRQYVHRNHISRRHLRMLETFQRQGGGDDSADLYPVKEKSGESYDKALFYAHIAPQLMVGLHRTGDENLDEDELYYENTLIRSSQRLCETKYAVDKCEAELSRITGAFDAMSALVDEAGVIDQAKEEYRRALDKVAEIGTIVELLSSSGLPGLPVWKTSGKPEVDAILKHMAVKPGTGPYLRASGLDALPGHRTARATQLIAKHGLLSTKVAEPIEIMGHVLPETGKGGKRNESFLSEQEALSFIQSVPVEALGLPRQDEQPARQRLEKTIIEVFAHFHDHMDTSPHRSQARGLQREADAVGNALRTTTAALKGQQKDLEKASRKIAENAGPRSQYERLQACPSFDKKDLENPLALREKLKAELAELQKRVDSLNRTLGGIKHLGERLEAFRRMYGHAEPLTVEQGMEERLLGLEKEASILREARGALKGTLADLEEGSKRLTEKATKIATQRAVFDRLQASAGQVRDMFPGMSVQDIPNHLAARREHLQARHTELSTRQATLKADLEMAEKAGRDAGAVDAEIKKLNASIERLRPDLEVLLQFKVRFGNQADPGEILQTRQERLRLGLQQRRRMHDLLAEEERKLRELADKGVAPGRIAAAALELLPAGSSWRPLWQVVESANLAPVVREKVLTALSSLLFSPVVEDQNVAANLASQFEEKNFPIPVFLASGVAPALASGRIEGIIEAVQGHMGEAAELLLHPEIREGQIDRLERKTGALRNGLDAMEKMLRLHQPDAPDMVLLAKAAKARQADVESRIANHQDDLKRKVDVLRVLSEEIGGLAERAGLVEYPEIPSPEQCGPWLSERSAKVVGILKKSQERIGGEIVTAQKELYQHDKEFSQSSPFAGKLSQTLEYEDMGGETAHQSVRDKDEATKRERDGQAQRQAEAKTDHDKVVDKLHAVERESDNIGHALKEFDFPALHDFIQSGEGHNVDALTVSLKEVERKRDETNGLLEYDFEEAARYVLVRQEDLSLREAVKGIEEAIKRLKDLEEQQDSAVKDVEARLKDCERMAWAYDTQIEKIQKKISEFVQVLEDIEGVDRRDSTASEAQEIVVQALREIKVATGERLGMLSENASEIVSALDSFNAGTKVERAKAAKNKIAEAIKGFEAKCRHFLVEQKANITPVITAGVAEAIVEPARIRSLFASVTKAVESKRANLAISQAEHTRIWDDQIARLTELAERAKNSFHLLRRVCAKYEDGATLFFSSSLATSDEIGDAIRLIRDRVEYEIRKQEKDVEEGRVVREWLLKMRKRESASLVDDVRDILYKTIFKDPIIHFRHPAIAAGRKIRMNVSDNVSKGQKTALQLLLLVRLAEFAKEREARRENPLYKHRRRISSQEHGFIILDGLFSNLSREGLIDESLQALDACKGVFQLVGLIHNRGYVNNRDIFPTFIVAKPYKADKQGLTQDYWYDFENKRDGETAFWHSTITGHVN